MSDEPFGNIDTEDQDVQIENFLGKFTSPEMAFFLRNVMQLGMGDAFRSHLGSDPMGANGLLGPANVGTGILDTFNSRILDATVKGSAEVAETTRQDINTRMHRMLGDTSEEAKANALNKLSPINLFGSMMMEGMEFRQLQSGLRQASGFMGAAAPIGLSPDAAKFQTEINDNANRINAAITHDYATNTEKYFGLRGRDVGRIAAELSRTGVIKHDMDVPQASPGGINAMSAGGMHASASVAPSSDQVIRLMRESAEMVSVGGRFFQGGAMDIVDSVNAMAGVNAVATLGGAAVSNQLRTMDATGTALGFNNDQMLSLAMGSSQVSNMMGLSSAGAMSNASLTGQIFGGGMRTNGLAFVNEKRARNSITRHVTGAQHSQSALAISGIRESISDKEGFMEAINGSETSLSLDEITEIGKKFDFQGDSFSAIAAGGTMGAEKFRMGGGATMAVMRERTQNTLNSREALLELFKVSSSDMDILRKKNFSMQAIEDLSTDQLSADGKTVIRKATLTKAQAGSIRRTFDAEADAMGSGNANTQDLEIAGVVGNDMNTLIRERIKRRVGTDKLLGSLGKTRGAQGLFAFAQGVEEGDESLGEMFKYITGKTDVTLEKSQLMGKEMKENLGKIMGGDNLEAQAGAEVVSQALLSGIHQGKLLSPEQREKFVGMLQSGKAEDLAKMGKTAGSDIRKKVLQGSAERSMSDSREREFETRKRKLEEGGTIVDAKGEAKILADIDKESEDEIDEIAKLQTMRKYIKGRGQEGDAKILTQIDENIRKIKQGGSQGMDAVEDNGGFFNLNPGAEKTFNKARQDARENDKDMGILEGAQSPMEWLKIKFDELIGAVNGVNKLQDTGPPVEKRH